MSAASRTSWASRMIASCRSVRCRIPPHISAIDVPGYGTRHCPGRSSRPPSPHQVEAIRDFTACGAADTVRVRPVPVTADDPNARRDREPVGHGVGGTHREDIHHAAPLQVHEDRADNAAGPSARPSHRCPRRAASCPRPGGAFDDAHLTTRTRVSAVTAVLRLANRRSPARPPNPCPTR